MTAFDPHHRRRRRICCCFTISLSILLLLALVFIILAFTVFKAKKPIIKLDDVRLQSFNSSFNVVHPSVNLTLAIVVSVYNPNKASFRYADSAAMVYYHGDEVALVPIPPGEIGSEATEVISTTVDVYADKLLTNIGGLLTDLTDGSLPFDSKTDISGKVKFLGFIQRHVDISSQCSFSISILKAAIEDQVCQNKISL